MEMISTKTGSERSRFFEKKETKRPCWNCQSDKVAQYNCVSCTAIQQFLRDTDYFSSFNIGYKLNIDLNQLEEVYFDLSRRFHPDYHQKGLKKEQEISLENTALLNKAYQTLKDPMERTAYLITLVEGNQILPTKAPEDLFEEIFEIQEMREEIQALDPSDTAGQLVRMNTLNTAAEKMRRYEEGEKKKLHELFIKWDQLEDEREGPQFTQAQRLCLVEMKQILSHAAYLDRVLQDIETTTLET